MKRTFLIGLILVFAITGCSMFQPVVKREALTKVAEVKAPQDAATMNKGILIKIDKKDNSQAALIEAVQILEKLYGTPLVLVSGGLATTGDGTKVSVVRYALYFEISESMYTVVSISNGTITEIIPINRAGRVLATMKMSVKKVLKASGIGGE